MLSDFRFALRQLRKNPGFAAVAVLTLALAIGVNSSMFALIHGVILRPVIPVRPDEVVNLFTAKQGAAKDYRQFSHAEYLALRDATDTFADVAAMNPILAGIGADDAVRRSFAFFVSENYFAMLGTAPAAGRFFSAEESRPGAARAVVVASYALWQRLGGRDDFVGSTLRVNGQPYTVIGVTRRGFSGLNALLAPDIWLPLGQFAAFANTFADSRDFQDLASPRNFTLNLTARLAPGVTREQLTARLPALAQRLDAVQPPDLASTGRDLQFETPSRFSISTTPSGDGSAFPLAGTLAGMAGCVLLIASLNLANMLLARGTARAREIAVRLALGATRGRIIRQLLAEGLVLSLLGGALGLLLALWCNDLLFSSLTTLFSTMNFSLAVEATPDGAALLGTFGLALGATLLFSLGPALRASRADLVHDLKQQGGDPGGAGLGRFFSGRNLLVMGQIALSFMLLFSAALFVRSALAAGSVALGFEPRGQLIAELDYSLGNTPPPAAKRSVASVLDRVRSLPGVTAAAIATQIPYGNVTNMPRFVDAASAPAAKTDPNAPEPGANALLTATTPGYFDALGARLRRGRDFTALEAMDEKAPRVAIIDETLAQRLFPEGDALGRRLRYTVPPADGSPADMEIIGICAPHRHDAGHATDRPRVFVPYTQAYSTGLFLHVRFAATDDAALTALAPTLRAALREIDPLLPVLQIKPMANHLDGNIQLWVYRVGAVLFGVFGGIALVLAAVGAYGVKAYAVARRTREFGIRLAIGARPGDVFGLVMKQGVLQVAVALAAGLLLALGAGRILGGFLSRVSPFDPLALGLAGGILAAAALIACYLPARRATKVNPMNALRTE